MDTLAGSETAGAGARSFARNSWAPGGLQLLGSNKAVMPARGRDAVPTRRGWRLPKERRGGKAARPCFGSKAAAAQRSVDGARRRAIRALRDRLRQLAGCPRLRGTEERRPPERIPAPAWAAHPQTHRSQRRGGRSPRLGGEDSVIDRTAPMDGGRRAKVWTSASSAAGGCGVADGSVVSGGVTTTGAVSGPCGGDLVAVELGEVVGRHQ